eukprot:gene39313-26123_t
MPARKVEEVTAAPPAAAPSAGTAQPAAPSAAAVVEEWRLQERRLNDVRERERLQQEQHVKHA